MRCTLLWLFIVLLVPVRGDEPPIQIPVSPAWNITAECLMVILPQKAALPLIGAFSEDEQSDAAWDKVQKLIETGEAAITADLLLRAANGRTTIAKNVEEVRYPSELQAPDIPYKIPAEHPIEHPIESLKAWPPPLVAATAFETREVGQILSLTVHVSEDGKWLDIDAIPEHVRLLRSDKFEAGRLANGEHLTVSQPQFHSMKDTLGMRLHSGQKALLSVHKVPGSESSYEFFLLRISATKAGTSP